MDIVTTTGTNVGPITNDIVLRQIITSTKKNLSGISLYVATYGKTFDSEITVKLLEPSTFNLHRSTVFNSKDIQDNSWHNFIFEPIADSEGKEYILEVTTNATDRNYAITLWTNNAVDADHGLSLHAEKNGDEIQEAICYKTIYTADYAYTLDSFFAGNNPQNLNSENQHIIQEILKYCVMKKGHYISRLMGLVDAFGRSEGIESILSIGCGECLQESFLGSRFPELKIHATDFKLVPAIYPRDNMEFSEKDILVDWNDDRLYDFVFSIECLEHIKDFDTAFHNHANKVKPGKYLYISVPFASPEEKADETLQKQEWDLHEHFTPGFTHDELKKKFEDEDFEIIFQGNMFHEFIVPPLNQLLGLMTPEEIEQSMHSLLTLFKQDIREQKASNRSKARGIRVLGKKR